MRSRLVLVGCAVGLGDAVERVVLEDEKSLTNLTRRCALDPVTYGAARTFLRDGVGGVTLLLCPPHWLDADRAQATVRALLARAPELSRAHGLVAGPVLCILPDPRRLAGMQVALFGLADALDALALVDPPRRREDLETWADALALSAGSQLACGASWWPWIGAGVTLAPPAVRVGALIASLSAGAPGPGRAPANLPLPGGLVPEVRVGPLELRAVSGCGMNLMRHIPGVGVAPWGAVTLGQREGVGAVVARRVYGLAVDRLRGVGERAMFEPVTPSLRGAVQRRAFGVLQGLANEGLLAPGPSDPGFFVRCEVAADPAPMIHIQARLRPISALNTVDVDVVLEA